MDPLRNRRPTKVEKSEQQIFRLVTDYNEVDPQLRQILPYLQRVQYHLATFNVTANNAVEGNTTANSAEEDEEECSTASSIEEGEITEWKS